MIELIIGTRATFLLITRAFKAKLKKSCEVLCLLVWCCIARNKATWVFDDIIFFVWSISLWYLNISIVYARHMYTYRMRMFVTCMRVTCVRVAYIRATCIRVTCIHVTHIRVICRSAKQECTQKNFWQRRQESIGMRDSTPFMANKMSNFDDSSNLYPRFCPLRKIEDVILTGIPLS